MALLRRVRGGKPAAKRRTLGRGDAESFIDALESAGARAKELDHEAEGSIRAAAGVANMERQRSLRGDVLGQGRVPKTVPRQDVAAGAPRDGFTAFFGTRP